MSNKTKEELIDYWRSKHSWHSRMCPSEQFVEENSGKEVGTPSSSVALSSSGDELDPQVLPAFPEKKEKIQICNFCMKRFRGARFSHELECSKKTISKDFREKDSFTKTDRKWVSDFVEYNNSLDDSDVEFSENDEGLEE